MVILKKQNMIKYITQDTNQNFVHRFAKVKKPTIDNYPPFRPILVTSSTI